MNNTRSKIWTWFLAYVINSKEASGKACEIWLKYRLLKDMTTFQTLQTWIGHNVTRYGNLNTLPHRLPNALSYIFFEICLVLGYFKEVTTRYGQFFKLKINIYFFINLTITRGNPLHIAPNHAKLKKNVQ